MSIKFPARRLVSQEDSALVQRPDVPRSKFTGSWTRKTTFNAGQLIPFMCEEVLPGDMLKYDVTAYVRMSTPLFPIMDNQRIDTFFFFVPNRLVWDNWVKFMGEQVDPDSSINYTVPVVTTPLGGFAPNSVFDHFGLPTTGQLDPAGALFVNVMPLRAYNLIYNQWFRDENLQNSAYFTKADTDIGAPATNYALRYRAKSADYFTSCLPWPQKFTAPTVPLGGNAPVTGLGFQDGAGVTSNVLVNFRQSNNVLAGYQDWMQSSDANNGGFYAQAIPVGGGNYRPNVFADLSAASGVAINTLRQAFLTQQLLERDARGGTRYTEIVKSHFGVTSPDMRLQRPEYCGGGSSPFNITPVAQTVPFVAGEDSSPLGNLGGAGTSVGQHRASYAATEHGYIIGLINVKSELSYQQGIHKMWTRQTRYDFYWPSLAGLGEQAVLRKEIYVRGIPASDDAVFGYQERWHEYRTHVSEVTGMFKSTTAGNIDEWHLAQELSNPTLSSSFIVDDPPMNRVLAGELVPNNYLSYLADILIRREAVRPLPVYGTPVTLGRF